MENRLLKFRAWHPQDNKFIYYSLDDLKDDILASFCFENPQQFTGILDISNEEIYEGDIIKCEAKQMTKNNTPIEYLKDYYGIIEYHPPSFQIKTNTTPIFWTGIEIVGNIFENPELLNLVIK